MFPSLRQRLFITAALLIGAVCLTLAGGAIGTVDGVQGFTLVRDDLAATLGSVGIIALAALPCMALGLLTSATGHPLSGIFAVAAALSVLAWWGGPIDGYLRRMASNDALPGGYALLMIEMLIWQVGVVVMLLGVQHLRSPMRTRWPALAFDDHLDVDTHIRLPQLQAIAAGLTAALVAGIGAWVLLRDSDVGQVMCGLVLVFTIGALVAQLSFPQNNPVGILFSPALVALIAYGHVYLTYSDTARVMLAWFNIDMLEMGRLGPGRMTGAALALPIHYVSAGIVGCTLGVGWAQVMQSSPEMRDQHVEAAVAHTTGIFGLYLHRKRRERKQREQDDHG